MPKQYVFHMVHEWKVISHNIDKPRIQHYHSNWDSEVPSSSFSRNWFWASKCVSLVPKLGSIIWLHELFTSFTHICAKDKSEYASHVHLCLSSSPSWAERNWVSDLDHDPDLNFVMQHEYIDITLSYSSFACLVLHQCSSWKTRATTKHSMWLMSSFHL